MLSDKKCILLSYHSQGNPCTLLSIKLVFAADPGTFLPSCSKQRYLKKDADDINELQQQIQVQVQLFLELKGLSSFFLQSKQSEKFAVDTTSFSSRSWHMSSCSGNWNAPLLSSCNCSNLRKLLLIPLASAADPGNIALVFRPGRLLFLLPFHCMRWSWSCMVLAYCWSRLSPRIVPGTVSWAELRQARRWRTPKEKT